MLNIKYLYEHYTQSVNYRIQFCITKIDEYQNTLNYLKECILNNEDHFVKYDITINNLLSHPYSAYSKISELVEKGHLSKVAHYVKSFSTTSRYISEYKIKYNKLLSSIITYDSYRKIVFAIHREASKYILEGNTWQFSIVGQIFIGQKSNEQALIYNSTPRVNWIKSNTYKQKLIESGLTPYDKNNNPTGVKWHIYHNNDFDYWWCWSGGYITNKSYYRFIPNNFCHSKGRSQILFTNNCKDKNKIYDSQSLGNRDKLQALLRFDSLHYLNYRKLETCVNN